MKTNGHYFQVGERPHTCRDGRKVTLFVWMGFCRVCGQPFEVTTLPPDDSGQVRTKALARVHCDAHKRGAKVGGNGSGEREMIGSCPALYITGNSRRAGPVDTNHSHGGHNI